MVDGLAGSWPPGRDGLGAGSRRRRL